MSSKDRVDPAKKRMTEQTKLLRAAAQTMRCLEHRHTATQLDDAADEIERLRAKLNKFRGLPEHWIGLDGEGGEPFDPDYIRRPAPETKEPQLPFGTSDGDLRYWTGFIDAAKLLEMDGPDPVWRMAESYKASVDLHHQRNAEKTTGVTIDSSRPKCPSCGMYAPDPGFPCGCCGRVASEKAGDGQ